MLKNGKNPWVSITHIDSLQQDSRCLYLHMNLNWNVTIVSESREGQAHIVPLT
jgi:hypothetical protein